jgi:hypothetical protein
MNQGHLLAPRLELADLVIEMRPDLLIVITFSGQNRPATQIEYPLFAKPFQPHELVAIGQNDDGRRAGLSDAGLTRLRQPSPRVGLL